MDQPKIEASLAGRMAFEKKINTVRRNIEAKQAKVADPLRDKALIQAAWRRYKKYVIGLLAKVTPAGWTEDRGNTQFLFKPIGDTTKLGIALRNIVVMDRPDLHILMKMVYDLLLDKTAQLAQINGLLARYNLVLVVVWDEDARVKYAKGEQPQPTTFHLVALDEFQKSGGVVPPPVIPKEG